MQGLLVVDTSVWVELLTGGPKSGLLKKQLQGNTLIAPEITLAELAAKLDAAGNNDIENILESITQKAQPRGINPWIAARAGKLRNANKKNGFGINDAIILATAEYYDARLLTLDNDFKPFKNTLLI